MLSDEWLIRCLRKKRENALREIIDKYGGYVYTIVRNIIGEVMQPEDVEEVVSEVFIKIWTNSDKFDIKRPLKPYLVGIARNEAREKLRKFRLTFPVEEVEIVQEDMLCEDLEKQEQLQIIENVLKQCEGQDKEIFVRYYYNYEKVRMIAEHCGVSESKVKMTLHRLRGKIKKELEEKGYGREV